MVTLTTFIVKHDSRLERAAATTGHYVEIWRKDTDGLWRCVIDFNHQAS
jgi:ketosteroid isomerase-like protein